MGRTNQLTSVAGAVLAGGASTRMGTDKAFPPQGQTLAPRCQSLTNGGCDPVVLVGKQPGLKHGMDRFGPRIRSMHPLSGILHALRHFQPSTRPLLCGRYGSRAPTHSTTTQFAAACVAASAEDWALSALPNWTVFTFPRWKRLSIQHGPAQDLFAGLARIVLLCGCPANCNTPQDWTIWV